MTPSSLNLSFFQRPPPNTITYGRPQSLSRDHHLTPSLAERYQYVNLGLEIQVLSTKPFLMECSKNPEYLVQTEGDDLEQGQS